MRCEPIRSTTRRGIWAAGFWRRKENFGGGIFRFRTRRQAHPVGRYLYDYALALVRADRFDDAQKQAEMAVRADAGLVEAHELLGGLYARKKELPEAAREYAAALR